MSEEVESPKSFREALFERARKQWQESGDHE